MSCPCRMEYVKSQVFDAVNGHYIRYDQHLHFDQVRLRDELLAMVPPPPPPPGVLEEIATYAKNDFTTTTTR